MEKNNMGKFPLSIFVHPPTYPIKKKEEPLPHSPLITNYTVS